MASELNSEDDWGDLRARRSGRSTQPVSYRESSDAEADDDVIEEEENEEPEEADEGYYQAEDDGDEVFQLYDSTPGFFTPRLSVCLVI